MPLELGPVEGFGIGLLLLRRGGRLGLGGEVAGEERRPEGGVEGEAAEAARGDGEAAEVAEPQRGGGGAELQDARPQLVGQIGCRHVRLDRITAGELRSGCSNRGRRAGVER